MSAIEWLTANQPQFATIKDVELIKTGIEYPLASGPHTFTEEELQSVVASQDDPGVASPRIWLGHPDDPRLHGKRHPGGPLSGEPSVGTVKNMYLADEGNTLRGDLVGTPIWLAKIMAVTYPSRSVEATANVETVTGHKWPLLMSGLALLGVCWPGVSTLEDIAVLYTTEGPDGVEVIEGTSEKPVTVVAASERLVMGQVTVEDLKRQFYEALPSMDIDSWSWIRGMYLDPPELIVDDDNGGLFRIAYAISGDAVEFEDPKAVKIKYVSAGTGGKLKPDFDHGEYVVATFDDKDSAKPKSNSTELEIDLKASQPKKGGELEFALPLVASDSVTLNIKLKEKS